MGIGAWLSGGFMPVSYRFLARSLQFMGLGFGHPGGHGGNFARRVLIFLRFLFNRFAHSAGPRYLGCWLGW